MPGIVVMVLVIERLLMRICPKANNENSTTKQNLANDHSFYTFFANIGFAILCFARQIVPGWQKMRRKTWGAGICIYPASTNVDLKFISCGLGQDSYFELEMPGKTVHH